MTIGYKMSLNIINGLPHTKTAVTSKLDIEKRFKYLQNFFFEDLSKKMKISIIWYVCKFHGHT